MKKALEIPTISEIQALSEVSKKSDLRREKIKAQKAAKEFLRRSKMTDDELAYEDMLKEVIMQIQIAACKQETMCSIRTDIQRCCSEDSKRKQAALDKIKPMLREMKYQTSWKREQIDDDGFNREHYDEFSISWDPKIRWNEFRE